MVEQIVNTQDKELSISNGNDQQTIVIDMGSDTIKAGFAGEDVPRAVFRNIFCRPILVTNHPGYSRMQGIDNKSEYFGDEAMHAGSILRYPILNGIVESWDDVERVLRYTFSKELRCKPEEAKGVILTE